jgi:hypothetical protein
MKKEMKYLLCLVLVVVLVNLVVPLVVKGLIDINHPVYGVAVKEIQKLSSKAGIGDKLLVFNFCSNVFPVISSLVLVVFVVLAVVITRAVC